MSSLTKYIQPIMLATGLNILLSVGAYFVAWQFNDGKNPADIMGASATVVAVFNLIIGRIVRIFRYPEAWVFLAFGITAGLVALVTALFVR
jgi:hypothetical protein